jgi:hypothetical protein
MATTSYWDLDGLRSTSTCDFERAVLFVLAAPDRHVQRYKIFVIFAREHGRERDMAGKWRCSESGSYCGSPFTKQ